MIGKTVLLIPNVVQNLAFPAAQKSPRIKDRKRPHIDLILGRLRSLIPGVLARSKCQLLNHVRYSLALVLSSLMLHSILCAEPQNLSWTPTNITHVKIIKDIQISPDNSTAIFAAIEPVMLDQKDRFLSKLYIVKIQEQQTQDPIPLIQNNISAFQPKWSPNGKWIAFLSDRNGTHNLYLINPFGGEDIPLTNSQKNIETFQWSPDSKQIAFVMPDDKTTENNSSFTSDAFVYQESNTINRLWLLDIATPEQFKYLTSNAYHLRGKGDFGTTNEEFDWSPDGKTITFAYSPGPGFENFYLKSSIASLDLPTGKITLWDKKAQHESLPRYSPDGTWISYLTSDTPARYTIDRQVAIRAADGSKFRKLSLTDNEGPLLFGPTILGWNASGTHVLFFEPKGTKFQILSLPLNGGRPEETITGDLTLQWPVLSQDRTLIGFVGQNTALPPEVYTTKLNSFKPVPISNLNAIYQSYPRLKTDIVRWKSTDGQTIEGLLTYPLNYQPGQRYPLLLVIHGGPMGVFSETFLGNAYPYPLTSFAEAGFAVFRPNPRGSTGYGKKFRQANVDDWAGEDYKDIMAGVDAMIANGIADEDKLGIMGWSYGGYMTAWIISHSSRFKAASVGAGPTNLTSMAGTTDLHSFMEDYLGDFIKNEALYKERSPLFFADQVKTPCLIQHGLDDERVPVSQAYEFYHALKNRSKDVTLVLYPRSGHRVTEPKLQIDLMERNLEWFKKHLKTSE